PGNDSLPAWLTVDAATGNLSGTPANADVGTLDVTVTATDSAGLSASDTFTLTVANVNDAPVVQTPIADLSATEDTAFTFNLTEGTFSDSDAGDTLSYTATLATDSDTIPGNDSLPAWLTVDAATGNLSGTPANADVGTLDVTVTATDSAGLSASDTFTLTVANVNDAPVVQTPIADLSATEDTAFTFTLTEGTFSDLDADDTLSYTATLATDSDTVPGNDSLPAWLSFDATTGNLSGTPANADVGTLEIALTATDSAGLSASDTFALTVANVNDPPVLATPILDLTATEDTAFTFTLTEGTFSDLDADDTLSYTATLATDSDTVPGNDSLPAWLSFDATTGNLSGTPANADVGTLEIALTATDSAGLSASDTFALTVANVNDAPVVQTPIADLSATEDTAFTFNLTEGTFSDSDAGDTLSYTATLATDSDTIPGNDSLPAWLTVDAATGNLSGTPANADVGTLEIALTATDSAGLSASDTFALTVANVNDPPVLATPILDLTATEDTAFTFTLTEGTFSDLDADDTLTYTATLATDSDTVPGNDSLPAWLTVDAATGNLSGTPANADVGTLDVTVTATDSAGAFASDTFTLTVANVNDAPTLNLDSLIPNQTAPVDTLFSFQVAENTFLDADAGDTLTYLATLEDGTALPAWLTFDPATGTFTGTPTSADADSLDITVTATDAAGESASDTFALGVGNIGAVKALFEAYEEVLNANPNQIDAVLDLVTDDITWSIHGGDRLRVQFANDYVGKEDTDPTDQTFAVGTYFRSLVANYFPRDFEPLEFIPNPDDPSQIAVRVRQNGAATQTGKTFESDYTYLVTVNDQGLISSLDGYFNTYPVAAAIADQPEIPADDPLTGELAPIDETFDPATARSVAEQMWTALAGGDVATAAGLNAPDATWSFAVGGPSFLPYVGAAQGFTSDGQPLAGDFSNAGPILGELLGPLGSVVTAGTITIQDTYVEGNRVLVQLQETGATAIETGQTYDLDLSSWITVGADGKIESNQVIVDTIRTVNALRPGATFPLSPEPGETRHAPPFFVAGSQINSQLLAYDEQGNFTGVLGQANGGDTAEFIGPIGLTYGPNGNVYIGMGLNRANGQIINAVLEYDGVSGEFIGERQNGFSGDGNNGVTDAFGDAFVFLDFSQNPPAPIADPDTGSLGSFINPATGAPFNPAVDVGVTPVPGLFIPTGLKFGPSSAANDGDKQNLYVSSGFTSRILEYDGETGQFLGTFGVRPNGAQGNFMVPGPGNTQPDFTVMIFGPDGNIYVTSILSDPDEDESNGEGAVLRFVGPGQVGPNGEAPGTLIGIGEHADLGIFGDASNAFEYTNLNGQPARLNETSAFAFGPDLDLYVNSALTGEVLKYAGPTKANAGEFLGVYADLKDEANGPATPAGANRESLALSGIGFGPDGTLYVGNSFENELGAPVAGSEFSAYTPDPANPNRGIYQGPFGDVSTADSRLLLPTTPEFVFTKNSYDELNTPHKRFDQVAFVVGSNAEGASATDNADALAAYDAAGNFIKFIGAEEAGQDSIPLEGIGGVVLAPSGKILVSSTQTNQVLEFNSLTGDYAGVFGDLNAGTTFNGTPLNSPTALTLGPNNDLYLIDAGNERVLRFDGSDGTFVENDANGDGTPDGVAVPSNGDAFADRLTDIAFGPDGRLYVAVNPPTNPDDPATPEVEAPQLGQAQIRVYNPNTGEQDVARSITGLNFVSSMAFGPDGRLYAIDAPSEIANPVDPVTGDPVTPGNSQIFVYNIDNTHPLEDAPTVAGQLDLGAAGAGDIDVSPDGLILGTNYAAGNLTQHTVTSNPDGTVTLAAGTPIAVGLPDAAADTDGLSRPTDPLFIAERFY
ncbi:MAG: putative Ig domain-containing protein, partial [Oscillatoria princeps RMCB-10]|nr:putative Ig domain-containing protein [Oscillatoria princeps RMCB-10]